MQTERQKHPPVGLYSLEQFSKITKQNMLKKGKFLAKIAASVIMKEWASDGKSFF
jgi:hypothetical protein